MTPAFPKRGPDAGTMDQVRPHCAAWHQTTLTVDWPTYPLQTPSGGGLAPTPDRSKTPAKGFLASGEEGLTNQGPLQKGAISAAHCAIPVTKASDVSTMTPASAFEMERRNARSLSSGRPKAGPRGLFGPPAHFQSRLKPHPMKHPTPVHE